MAGWRIVAGPVEFTSTPDGADIDMGWRWTIERDAVTRDVRVEIAGSRFDSSNLPDEAVKAVTSRGKSAVEAVLGEDQPPTRIVVSSAGVTPREP